ncbi:MAG TPA: hypothetical protein VMY87_09245 [Armatimonadota bacterium]|nr:hypothetical protein [Armatimonadota bacterium]
MVVVLSIALTVAAWAAPEEAAAGETREAVEVAAVQETGEAEEASEAADVDEDREEVEEEREEVEEDEGEECDSDFDPMLEMGVTENAKGTVYFYDERRPEIWATIGTRHGLRPQALVAIVRRGEIVAEGTVKDVNTSDCVIHPAPDTPAGTVLLGDDVRVLVNGPRAAMEAKIRRERSDRALGTFAAYAILTGCIWAQRF